jgi:hypothetical protein
MAHAAAFDPHDAGFIGAVTSSKIAAAGRLSIPPPLRILLSWTTIVVNTNIVAHGLAGADESLGRLAQ